MLVWTIVRSFQAAAVLLFPKTSSKNHLEGDCSASVYRLLLRLVSAIPLFLCSKQNQFTIYKNHTRTPLLQTFISLMIASAGFFLCPFTSFAEELSIISPQQIQVAGQPLRFHVQLRDFYQPQKTVVYYRSIGIARYRQLVLTPETGTDYVATLSGEKSFPPGVEFFFAVTDGNNQVFTFPSLDPQKNPYRIKISLDRAPPELLEYYPASGVSVVSTTPEIRLEFKDAESYVDPKSVRLVLDDLDITSLCTITRTTLHYTPSRPLQPGEHRLSLVLADVSGNLMPPEYWTFMLAPSEQKAELQVFDKGSADVYVNGEYRNQIVMDNDSGSSEWKFQSTIKASASAQKDNFAVSLKASANYIDEENFASEDDNFNLDHFLLQLEYGKQLLALGDVSVKGTDLIAATIARRGAHLALNHSGIRFESFALRSNYTTNFGKGLGLSNPDQLLKGGFVEKDLLANKKLTFKATYVDGRNGNPDDANASSLAAGTGGQIYSLQVMSQLFDDQLDFESEYAGSRFDSDLSDNLGEQSDYAWRAKLSGRRGKLDGSAGYRYLGPDFRSPVNPTGANDREEYNLSGGMRFNASSVRVSALHSENNVEQDPLFPVIKNTSFTLNYNVNIQNWPAFYFNYMQSQMASDNEPAGFIAMKNLTTSIGGGLSLVKNRWNLSPNYTYTSFDDRGASTNNDSRTHVMTLVAGYRPTDYSSINPMVSYVNTCSDATGVTTETWQSTLSGFASFYTGELNVNATLSFLDTQTDDDATHTSTYTAVTQLNWQVQQYLLKKGQQTFSLRGQFSRTENHITGTAEDNYAVYAVFSFGMPLKLF